MNNICIQQSKKIFNFGSSATAALKLGEKYQLIVSTIFCLCQKIKYMNVQNPMMKSNYGNWKKSGKKINWKISGNRKNRKLENEFSSFSNILKNKID